MNETRLQSLLDSGLRSITINLDGLEGSHNWMRGTGQSYKKAIQAICLLPSIPDLEYDVVTCVNKKSFSELTQIKEELINLGVKA